MLGWERDGEEIEDAAVTAAAVADGRVTHLTTVKELFRAAALLCRLRTAAATISAGFVAGLTSLKSSTADIPQLVPPAAAVSCS